jgi:hypothetical protein
VTVSAWPAGTTAEDSAVQHEREQYWRNTMGASTDPCTVDLSLDPSERPHGSLFGKRPDLINYGLTGFGREAAARNAA